jgi:hypothetical protein
MGNILSWRNQPKEIRIIYVSEKRTERIYPLLWPDSFAQFVLELYDLFPATKQLNQTKFLFQDACDNAVCICSETTFQALVPKHKQIAPTVDLYYVSLESWLI